MFESIHSFLNGITLNDAANNLISAAITTALWAAVWGAKRLCKRPLPTVIELPVLLPLSEDARALARLVSTANSLTTKGNLVLRSEYEGVAVGDVEDGSVMVDGVELVLSDSDKRQLAKLFADQAQALRDFEAQSAQNQARYKMGLDGSY